MKQYSPSDREGVFQLKTAVYGDSYREQEWVWKFESSPPGPARIYLAESEGMIVGLRTFLLREVKVLNDVWISALAVEGMVHPDFRRRGIWSALVREGVRRLRAEGVHLAFCIVGPHRHSYAGFCKLGWADVGSIPLLVKPLRVDGFLSKHVRSQRVQASANRISTVFFGTHRRRRPLQPSNLSIERIQSFDERSDLLWDEVSQQRMVSLVRDQKYLNHRYRDRPGEHYALFAAHKGRDLAGYIVVGRALQMFDLSVGLIMDISTTGETGVARSLVYEAISHLDQQAVDAIGCLMMRHSPYYRMLRRLGFFPVPSRLNPRDYHLVVEADPSKISRPVASDRGSWYLTWGDFDVA